MKRSGQSDEAGRWFWVAAAQPGSGAPRGRRVRRRRRHYGASHSSHTSPGRRGGVVFLTRPQARKSSGLVEQGGLNSPHLAARASIRFGCWWNSWALCRTKACDAEGASSPCTVLKHQARPSDLWASRDPQRGGSPTSQPGPLWCVVLKASLWRTQGSGRGSFMVFSGFFGGQPQGNAEVPPGWSRVWRQIFPWPTR